MDIAVIYRHERSRLLGIARRFGFSEEGAEDIVQQVFVKIMESPCLVATDKISTYMASMTRNLCIDLCRRERIRKTSCCDTRSLSEFSESMWYNDVPRRRLLELVYKAADDLSSDRCHREFRIYYLEGRSLKSIATQQGRPASTIQARVRRSRLSLASGLRQALNEQLASFSIEQNLEVANAL